MTKLKVKRERGEQTWRFLIEGFLDVDGVT